MVKANKHAMINHENCINDWIVIHWATETDRLGHQLNK